MKKLAMVILLAGFICLAAGASRAASLPPGSVVQKLKAVAALEGKGEKTLRASSISKPRCR